MITILLVVHRTERLKMAIEPAYSESGEVVWVSIFNSIENSAAKGKPRPAVLLYRRDGHWMTMGLTTNPRFRDGTPRVAIPAPERVGLKGTGYLWGDRATRVSALDIGDHIGWADAALAERIIAHAQLYGHVANGLREAAARFHPLPPASGVA